MSYVADYLAVEPTRSAVEALPGRVVLEFGAPWCGHCQAAQTAIRAWLDDAPAVSHLKVEDGKGRPLGRAFRVTLWPTVIALEDGKERARAVRPTRASDLDALKQALQLIGTDDASR